jgi:hypothetical protein
MNTEFFVGRSRVALGFVLLLVGLSACGNSDNDSPASIAPNSGFLTLRVTDAPVDDAAEVIIVFTGVELQRGPASTVNIDFDTPRSLDLLQFRNGQTANLLDGHPVLPGEYESLRLKISAEQNLQNGSRIRLRDGRQFPLFIPSGAESGLKLNRRFTVAQGGITRLIVDFDLRKSVVAPPGLAPNWILRPSLRLIDELQYGSLVGSVDVPALAAAQQTSVADCAPGVYVFAGSGVTPDDMDGDATDGVDPLVYQSVMPPTPGTSATYSLSFLESGEYTVAFTCRFNVDADPTRSEYDPRTLTSEGTPPMRFTIKAARITSGTTTRVDAP